MKWLLLLLVVLAGGVAAAAFAVPTNAVVVNGTAISQQSLNSDLTAIAGSPEYQCYVNSQALVSSNGQQVLPPVSGAGKSQDPDHHPTATTSYTASYLDLRIQHELVLQLAAQRHIEVTQAQLDQARSDYTTQITRVMAEIAQTAEGQNPRYTCGSTTPLTGSEVLATMPSSFVDQQVQFVATTVALEEDLSGIGSSESDLQAYFEQHRSEFDTVCVVLAGYSTESDATAAAAKVAAGTPFSQVAQQAQQPQQGCVNQSQLSAQLPGAKLDSLAVGAVSEPIQVSSGYILLQVTSRTPADYSQVKSDVSQAAQEKGSSKASTAITAVTRHADVSIDPRYGVWVSTAGQVFIPFVPKTSDVLNPVANSPVAAAAGSSSPSGG
jgi:parvulin-like peptidyl-prolyl isomerase